MLGTMAGTSLLARATPSYQTADADQSAVDGVPTAVKSDTTDNARHSFDYLADQYENESQIDNGHDKQNHVGYPLARFNPDGHLDRDGNDQD
jgi:hypothetical protein